mmetsp:Transcript_37987/g.62807  ORF Transcript_37987/g.62807 Transcript_37987/m.62807 type:complete len:414 (-) Transcript_37987:96-1337(-)|eukprot:CAMPEP_0119299122 /NCGR_PEP_ID=MMETSP1333-20130426/1233_1 /TAXON_ID=418940 /ORGANISM="Scyphosphaera apsteinii, Strain RCC1455" /LENGTH=413 /DNA_ID=CAMNT_0007300443 /DNA_START=110 /DNA_END=1351 /DNA_ORIENTATION=+
MRVIATLDPAIFSMVASVLLLRVWLSGTVPAIMSRESPLSTEGTAPNTTVPTNTDAPDARVSENAHLSTQPLQSTSQQFLPLLNDLQPDEVRLMAPLVSESSRELRCGLPLPPESVTETKHGNAAVTIFARSTYQGTKEDGSHLFHYIVEFTNSGKLPVHLISRHWLFATAKGDASEMKGPGASGSMPRLLPGEKFEYKSGVQLPTRYGAMQGSFQFEALNDDELAHPPLPTPTAFSCAVGRLVLAADGREKEVPCVRPANISKMLPTTSVYHTDRVVVGVTIEYASAESEPDTSSFSFVYTMQIHNARRTPVVILGRRLEMIDGRGQTYTDEAAGLGGKSNVGRVQLQPEAEVRYSGSFVLPTDTGNFAGYFLVAGSDPEGGEDMVQVGPTGVSRTGRPVAVVKPIEFLRHD